MAAQIATSVLTLLAGVGVFLVACTMMSSNLESVSANKLRALFAKTSKNKLVGVGIGTVATAAIQSSGATSVMVIGFVNAGIMTLSQAATVIFGANIGTTITGQITALGMFESTVSTGVVFATFAGIGAFISVLAKRDNVKKLGGILAGFGMLFVGLDLMSGSMDTFAKLDSVKTFLSTISNPLLLVLIGTAITAVIQSSSVMTSIAITMVFTGLIDLNQGIYLTMGSNIGSCVVAVIAGITGSTNAKRTALIHLTFNVTGVAVFMLIGMIMRVSTKGAVTFGGLFEKMFPGVPQTQLAMFHTIFNLITVVMVLPITSLMVKFVSKVIPEKKGDDNELHCAYLDDNFLSAPPIAVAQVKREIISMAELAKTNFDISLDTVCTLDYNRKNEFRRNEEKLDYLNGAITKFIVKLQKLALSAADMDYMATVFHTVTDLERIGDYAENIMEYAEKLTSLGSGFSSDAVEEIRNLQKKIDDLYGNVMMFYVTADQKIFRDIYVIEENVDILTERMANMHIKRLDDGICSPDIGAPYLSLTSNAERVADHFVNVANAILSFAKQDVRNELKSLREQLKIEFETAESVTLAYDSTSAIETRDFGNLIIADENENSTHQELTENKD